MRPATTLFVVLLLLEVPPAAANREAPAVRPLGRVPEVASAWANPLASDSASVPAGRKLFERHCAGCHGLLGGGSRKGPALDTPQVRAAPAGSLFWVISHGSVRKGMPVWTKLPEPQRWQIVSYLETLSEAGGPGMP